MRRHDLDWLRVIVFGLLIFYHVGMFFVPWGFHIKNNVTYEWLTYPMWFVNQWRLPILFVISGMGTYYALQKRTGLKFTFERLKRLGLPLIFGMVCIVPPQVYFERLDKNQFAGGYLDFWPSQALMGVFPEGNLSWHHLWFLPYLLIFSLTLLPIFIYLKKHPSNWFITQINQLIKKPLGLYLFIVPLYFIEAYLEPRFPVTHGLVGDWFTIISCSTLFFFGFVLISVKDSFWPTVEEHRKFYLISGIISFTIMFLITSRFEDSASRHYTEAFFKVVNLWSWILALFGFAAKYLNKESNILSYSNTAVYPFYILHQTVMIVMAYYLMNLEWTLSLKAFIMVIGTFGFSWLIYEFLIRRWKYIRPFFGLKNILNKR